VRLCSAGANGTQLLLDRYLSVQFIAIRSWRGLLASGEKWQLQEHRFWLASQLPKPVTGASVVVTEPGLGSRRESLGGVAVLRHSAWQAVCNAEVAASQPH
jgi:hypothetical protein